jgi:L-seryl-tRNA(Ser) seleniumtransferase
VAAEHDLSAVTSDSPSPSTSTSTPTPVPPQASDIPSLDRLLNDAAFAPLLTKYARTQVTAALRGELERLRGELERLGGGAAGGSLTVDALSARAIASHVGAGLERRARPQLRAVFNLTGTVLHTNLGRALLADTAVQSVVRALTAPVNLEFDLNSGGRGDRDDLVEPLLCELTGADAATVVNNNAAAVLLMLAGLAHGRAAIVSRGELVEIGGSFRVPEIMAAAGVRLVEVGTTNRTHLRDYESAIDAETALLVKVHRSNFALRGFVAEVELAELAGLAERSRLPLAEDLGSGTLIDLSPHGIPGEVFAPGHLARGAGVVCFSADKLLGGPQAGIILTRDAALADRLRRHPLARALRLDKLSLAALDWTLSAHLEGRAEAEIPVLRQLLAPGDELRRRATSLCERLCAGEDPRAKAHVEMDRSYAGGGSLPDHALDSWVVTVEAPAGADRLAARLRAGRPPGLARVRDDRVILDVRTLLDGDDDGLARALREALR